MNRLFTFVAALSLSISVFAGDMVVHTGNGYAVIHPFPTSSVVTDFRLCSELRCNAATAKIHFCKLKNDTYWHLYNKNRYICKGTPSLRGNLLMYNKRREYKELPLVILNLFQDLTASLY